MNREEKKQNKKAAKRTETSSRLALKPIALQRRPEEIALLPSLRAGCRAMKFV
ncbi:hypothetical protein [Flaviaesturariibacter terrae]